MHNDNEKANAFLNNINSDAEEMCGKIKRETDRYVATELNKAREHAHEDVKSFKKSEIDRLNEENNASFSELEAQETRKLLDRRSQITAEVFERAEKKLSDFTQTPSYPDFLKKSIAQIKSKLGDGAVIILKPDDKKYEAEISPLCAEIKYDSSIRIGGCRAENKAAGLIADDTLETRLEEEKSNFYKASGMSITL